MKTPIQQYAKGKTAPKMDGTNVGRINVTMHSAGETGDYGAGKGKARIPEAFATDRHMEMSNEGKYMK